jgi:hypothetical protein
MTRNPSTNSPSQLVISFLSSSSGPLQPTDKMKSPDIQVGIPSMLLCIEMAIFAVMHLFAFPWREYDLSKTPYADPITAPGSGFSGNAPKYHGGWLGIKAYRDTFNPWDLIKATARGFRWLFVRRKTRHTDSSYITPKINVTADAPATSIPGPNVTSHKISPGTELEQPRRARADTADDADTAGLLSNAQQTSSAARQSSQGPSHSSLRSGSYDDISGHSPKVLNRWDTDTEYHSAAAGSASTGAYNGLDANAESSAGQWNHWAGTERR